MGGLKRCMMNQRLDSSQNLMTIHFLTSCLPNPSHVSFDNVTKKSSSLTKWSKPIEFDQKFKADKHELF
jgi:hypothetical protein